MPMTSMPPTEAERTADAHMASVLRTPSWMPTAGIKMLDRVTAVPTTADAPTANTPTSIAMRLPKTLTTVADCRWLMNVSWTGSAVSFSQPIVSAMTRRIPPHTSAATPTGKQNSATGPPHCCGRQPHDAAVGAQNPQIIQTTSTASVVHARSSRPTLPLASIPTSK